MNSTIFGAGYVGLVSGACLAELGHQIVCCDLDAARIAALSRGELPIHEPGLGELVRRHLASGQLRFAPAGAAAAAEAEVVFIAVGTPTRRGDGHADVTFVHAAAAAAAQALTRPALVVTKSTVPVGTTREVARLVRAQRPELEVAANPEFLREGSAVEDFLHPDRIVLGVDGSGAEQLLRRVYAPLSAGGARILSTSYETAELIKYAANGFLATKLTYLNELTALCEAVGGDLEALLAGLAMDPRIGAAYLRPGPGFGGSCLPKDVQALMRTAQQHGVACRVVESVIEANAAHQARMVRKIRGALGGSEAGKTIAVLGLTFKADTDDMRHAPSLAILPALADRGAIIRAHDPQGLREARGLLPAACELSDDLDRVLTGADAVVLMTDWPVYLRLDFAAVARQLAGRVVIDLRNALPAATLRGHGLEVHRLGSRAGAPGAAR